MRSPLAIAATVCLGLALGGCSLTKANPTTPANVSGPVKALGTLVSNFSSDANSGNQAKICSSILSTALEQALNRHGGCETDVSNQLASINDFTLTITKYNVSGNSAVAVVKSPYDGKTRPATLHFVKQPQGGWRISGIS